MDRKRVKPDFGDVGDFSPSPRKEPNKPPKSEIKKKAGSAGDKEGFTSRTSKPKIDGRTLRATGRSAQLNMSVKPKTRDQFWKAAKEGGFKSGEDFLLHLLNRRRN